MRQISIWRATIATLSLLTASATSTYAQFLFGDTLYRYEVAYSFRQAMGPPVYQINNVGRTFGASFTAAGPWIGGIFHSDTIVVAATNSTYAEGFFPGTAELLDAANAFPVHRSLAGNTAEDQKAKSLDEVVMRYGSGFWPVLPNDTINDEYLTLDVTQTSYYWPVEYAWDILLIDYEITNLSFTDLQDVYLGVFFPGLDGGPAHTTLRNVYGYLKEAPAFTREQSVCQFTETLNMPWVANADGNPDPFTGEFGMFARTGISGILILNPSTGILKPSWNWWITPDEGFGEEFQGQDFGPRKKGTRDKPFRNWGVLGTPQTDADRYSIMANGETDYDQYTTAINHEFDGWLEPPKDALNVVRGRPSTHSVYSIGPIQLGRGQTTHFTIAVLFGEHFHKTPLPLFDKLDPYNPQPFYDTHLDFSDIIKNATWARWIYDNPGVDTDSDGYRGQYRLCQTQTDTGLVTDTLWRTGDGVPDFRGVEPPPAPEVRVTTRNGVIILQWNGLHSETQPDYFTRELDFEGYRVYWSRTNQFDDLQMISSYDIEDYTQYVLVHDTEGVVRGDFWQVIRRPFSLQEAQDAYANGSRDWIPTLNGRDQPLRFGDSLFYFTTTDWNQDNLRDTTLIHKAYPDAPYPHTLNIDSAYTDELTPDGRYFKYFEYRYIFDRILPSVQYFVSVTAFDFGAPNVGLGGLESNRLNTLHEALAQDRVAASSTDGLHVIVYPNPYRIDGDYRADGFEGFGRNDMPDERVRAVHFTGLPPVCTIRIYSLDGDLIWQIDHDKAPDDPSAMHDVWGVVSRNLLPVVSGIYYFVVETPTGETQIGKIVLIM